ncbi:MAG: sulfurtransferase TusA family protein [Candidatus Saccharimonadales bacterium]
MTTEQLATLTADKVIEARGTACPGPLLEAKKGIGGVPVGQIIKSLETSVTKRLAKSFR